jgi:hypothetical protein
MELPAHQGQRASTMIQKQYREFHVSTSAANYFDQGSTV